MEYKGDDKRNGYGRRRDPHLDGPCIQERCIEVIKSDIKTLEGFEHECNRRLSSVEQISNINQDEIGGVKKMLNKIFIVVVFTSFSVIVTLVTLLYRHVG